MAQKFRVWLQLAVNQEYDTEHAFAGDRIWTAAVGKELWAKPLPGGELAVLLINASPRPLVAGAKTLSFAALNLTTTSVTVRDIWNRSSLGSFHGVWPVPTVPPFDSVFVRLAPE